MTKTILMVAYLYPPIGGGGVQRTVKFAKYLPDFGITPIILSAKTSNKKIEDKTFTSASRHLVKRVRTLNLDARLSRVLEPFLVPDVQRLWVGRAVRQGLISSVRNKVELIYSTSMPYSNHLVAMRIAKKLNLPWIADFRDLWTKNALYQPRGFYQKFFHRRLEKLIYAQATHICATSPTQRQVIIERFGVKPDKISVITNGFDPADFTSSAKQASNKPAHSTSQKKSITVSYFGSFYGKYQPLDFIKALESIKQNNPKQLSNVEFLFVGDMDRTSRKLLSTPALKKNIKLKGFVPHGELQKLRIISDAFFLYLPDLKGPIAAMIPQKLFEYLAAKKPIFAVLPKSDAANIINKVAGGTIAPANNPDLIAKLLKQFIEGLRQGEIKGTRADLTVYTRPFLTGELSKIINRYYASDKK